MNLFITREILNKIIFSRFLWPVFSSLVVFLGDFWRARLISFIKLNHYKRKYLILLFFIENVSKLLGLYPIANRLALSRPLDGIAN